MDVEIRQGDFKTAFSLLDSQLKSSDKTVDYEILHQDNDLCVLRLGTRVIQVYNIKITQDRISFNHEGIPYQFEVRDEQAMLMEKMGFKSSNQQMAGVIKSPMPGKILQIFKKPGDIVHIGEPVAVLEAMKMENELKSPIDGIIEQLFVKIGDSVEKNHTLMEIK
jgi:biotin carboxyl carrier protein